jgi:hypothetical protein
MSALDPLRTLSRQCIFMTMHPSLHDTRQRLTATNSAREVGFCSICLDRPSRADEAPRLPADGIVTFRLKTFPTPPERIIGYLFREDNGCLLSELGSGVEIAAGDELECTFLLPPDLPRTRVCLVIEGRWQGRLAGCEMGFLPHH